MTLSVAYRRRDRRSARRRASPCMPHMAAESASFSGVLWFMMMSRNLMNEPFSRAFVKMSAVEFVLRQQRIGFLEAFASACIAFHCPTQPHSLRDIGMHTSTEPASPHTTS